MANGRIRIGAVNPGTYSLVAENGAYALSGQIAALSYGEIGGSEWASQPGFTVTGGTTLGDTVTVAISGGGFGVKPNSSKCVYAKFWEDGDTDFTSSSTLCRSVLTPSKSSRATVISSQPAGVDGNSMQYTYSGTGSGGYIGPIIVGGGNKQFWFARTRLNFDGLDAYPGGPLTWNQKWWRYWATTGTPNNNIIVGAYGQQNQADGNPRLTAENTNASTADAHGLDTFTDTWVTEQVRLRQSSGINIDDALCRWIANGVLEERAEFLTRTTSHPDLYTEFFFPQEQGDWASTSFRYWCSEFYLDDSWCHAVLTNSATYSETAGNSFEICPILSWSDTEVEIYIRPKVGLNHLHIMDNDGTTYYVGMR